MEKEKLTLAGIKDGALLEQFDRELDHVIDNLADINSMLKSRTITLTVKITPNKDRTFLELEADVKSKLIGQDPLTMTADLTFDDRGRAMALCRKSRQLDIPFNVTTRQQGGSDD